MRRHRAEALRNLPKPTGAARCVSTWREADGEVRECRQAVYGSGRVRRRIRGLPGRRAGQAFFVLGRALAGSWCKEAARGGRAWLAVGPSGWVRPGRHGRGVVGAAAPEGQRDCRELQKGRTVGGDTIEIWGQS